MKITFNDSNRSLYYDLIVDIQYYHGIDENRYKINGTEYTVPDDYLGTSQVKEMRSNNVVINDFSIWLEVQDIYMNNDLPSGLTFSKTFDENGQEINTKWVDLSVLSIGTNSKIMYLQGNTSSISESDLNILDSEPECVVLSMSELFFRMSEEDYFVPGLEGSTYQPYTFFTYESLDSEWLRYFRTWYDAQTYMSEMWLVVPGDRYYPVKWRIEQPLTPEEETIAYSIYPNFPYKEINL